MMNDDMALLREFAASQSERAFETLVSRHISLVHSAALRRTGDTHLAEEITQAVFIILARKAGSLGEKTVLSGWLYRTAQFAAADALKMQRRRQRREQEAYMQSILENADSQNETWNELAPILDEAMMRLRQADRDAILLRYFENKSLTEVGDVLGLQERAAQKRIARALEKLRTFFAKRGVALSATAIVGAVSANAVQAAPIALTKSLTVVAVAKGSIATASTLTLVKGTMKMMTWMKIKLALAIGIGAMIAIVASTAMLAQNRNQIISVTDDTQNNESILITPNVSVGKVKVGMSEDEVAAALGKPEKMQGDVMIYDKQFGFSVVCNRKKIVGDVFCGDSMLDYPGVKKFKGRTKEGIGMESSREDLIKAFGQPTSASPWNAKYQQEQLEYKPLGLTFLLENGKVFHITVNLRKPQ